MLIFTCSAGPVSHTVSIMVPTPLSPSLYWSLLTHYGAYVAGLTGCTTRETPRALNGWQSNSQEYLQGGYFSCWQVGYSSGGLLTQWVTGENCWWGGRTNSTAGRWELYWHKLSEYPHFWLKWWGTHSLRDRWEKLVRWGPLTQQFSLFFLLKEIFVGKCITNLGMFIYHYNTVSTIFLHSAMILCNDTQLNPTHNYQLQSVGAADSACLQWCLSLVIPRETVRVIALNLVCDEVYPTVHRTRGHKQSSKCVWNILLTLTKFAPFNINFSWWNFAQNTAEWLLCHSVNF